MAVAHAQAGSEEVELLVQLGTTAIETQTAAGLRPGLVVPLDQFVTAPVEVFADGDPIARGELVIHDGLYMVRVTETLVGRRSSRRAA